MAELSVTSLRPVGRYALGAAFSDGHDSILPYRELRARCPCDGCASGRVEGAPSEIADLQQIGTSTVSIRWSDGHETLYVAEELRGMCRCAHCVGEPNYPITRQ